jgi:hypothetical protein
LPEGASDAVFVTSIETAQKDRRILYANPAAAVLGGTNASALYGVHSSRLVPVERQEALHARVLETIEHGRCDEQGGQGCPPSTMRYQPAKFSLIGYGDCNAW